MHDVETSIARLSQKVEDRVASLRIPMKLLKNSVAAMDVCVHLVLSSLMVVWPARVGISCCRGCMCLLLSCMRVSSVCVTVPSRAVVCACLLYADNKARSTGSYESAWTTLCPMSAS
jgi:hypothetical protein